jgi:predicted DNA-binding transcriptional regulator AlpA
MPKSDSQQRHPTVGERSEHPSELRPLLGVNEVSNILGVPRATLYRWHSMTSPGNLIGPRAFRVGRHLRYALDDLATYIDKLRSDTR